MTYWWTSPTTWLPPEPKMTEEETREYERKEKLTRLCETINTGDMVEVILERGLVTGTAKVDGKRVVVAGLCTVRDVHGLHVSSNILDIDIVERVFKAQPEPKQGSVVQCEGCGRRFHRIAVFEGARECWFREDQVDEPFTWENLTRGSVCGVMTTLWEPK